MAEEKHFDIAREQQGAPGERGGRLEQVRDRLYSRTSRQERRRPQLSPKTTAPVPPSPVAPLPAFDPPASPAPLPPMATYIKKSSYRTKILLGGILFFAVALLLSSAFLFFGQNTISGNNISVEVNAPFVIGGGEEVELGIAIHNRNSVAVESATLIVEYPPGTQAADGSGRELFRERFPLERIDSGEALNVPVRARLFGEENEEKTILISVEYRVAGSNATFYKEAKPLRIKVSSSPVVIMVKAVEEISAGQPLTFELTIAANSPTPLSDVIVQATYPLGFDFTKADPVPVSGQNVWRIGTLEPESERTIRVEGVLTGASAEARTFGFSVGVPSERDELALASVLGTVSHEVSLTDPFVGLAVAMNGSTDATISVAPDATVSVAITFENTLSSTIYDGEVKAVLSGNGLNANNINVEQGFYNSSANTITWDAQSIHGFEAMTPGERETVRFSIRGANIDASRTPQITFDVSVRGRRVSENNVPQELTNVEARTVRFNTVASVLGHALHSIGPFVNSGPLPPVAEETTQYTVMLSVKNGSNELAGAVVTAVLPLYVEWLGNISNGGVTYNPSTREVSWNIGNVSAGASPTAAFQVSFLPSVSQVDTVPTIVGEQRLRATDRFTNAVVRATAPALTTRLPEDPAPGARDGRVLPKNN